MESICEDQEVQLATSWLRFSQQKGTGKSIVDGFIAQESVKIAVETKLGEKFGLAQLRNHLEVFRNEQHKLLILLSRANQNTPQLESIRKVALARNIQVIHTSFEEIVKKAGDCLSDYDEEMRALVQDYESFLSDKGLLPTDQYTLFVPPCGLSIEINRKLQLYYCPESWSRRNSRYLGLYAKRVVQAIGRIAKVVRCTVNLKTRSVNVVEGKEKLSLDERNRILEAALEGQKREWNLTSGHKFYLCDSMEETDFRKPSSGGIWGHRYFDLKEVLGGKLPGDLKGIAAALRGREWPPA